MPKSKRRSKGEGSIFYREDKGLWCASVTVGKDVNGKTLKKYLYSSSREELIEKKKRLESEIVTGEYIKPTLITVSAFLNEWLKSCCKPSLRPSTYIRYQSIVKVHINPFMGHVQLHKLTALHIQTFYNNKLQEGLKPRSIRNIHIVMHKALNQAVKWSLIAKNVSDLIELPKPKKNEMKVLSSEQVRQFLELAEGDRYYCLYLLAIATGLRQGELIGLQWDDIKMNEGFLYVRRTVKELSGELIIGEPKTSSGRRIVTLPEFAIKALEEHKEKQIPLNKWVFVDSKGGLVRAQNMYNRSFKPLVIKSGLPSIRFHDLRHTHATLLLQQRVNPKILQERLGHASVTLTLDTYSHVLPDMQRIAADELDSMFNR